ncbi:MAG: alpha/beta hydrolase [Alphaproteobacteria bacterium]|nr:alpha/beta hydrolase [Alphaproteobacteria bacterium]
MAAVYGAYDQAALDKEYDNRARVAEHPRHIEGWAQRSAEIRNQMTVDLDLAYGPDARHRLDFFPAPQRDAPLLVFIHGGYWQALDKSFFSHIAPPYIASGIAVAVLNYRLAPAHRLDDIVADMRLAVVWLAQQARDLGIDAARIHAAGHSAGGHLAACLLSDGLVRGACGISGLYDLEPIRLSYLNQVLALDATAARRLSPIHTPPAEARPILLAVGGLESAEYHRQQGDYVAALRAARRPVIALTLAGRHHFDSVDALCDPQDALFDGMLRQILAPSF